MNITPRQQKWLFSIVVVVAAVVLALAKAIEGDVALAAILGAAGQNAANRAIGRPQ